MDSPVRRPDAEFPFDPLRNDAEALRHGVATNLLFRIGRNPPTANDQDWYQAVARSVRDRLVER